MYHIFVYGSLRVGEEAHFRMKESTLVRQNCHIYGYSMFIQGDYPAVIADEGGSIWGDILKVDDKILAELDVYEEVDQNEYLRVFDDRYQFFIYISAKNRLPIENRVLSGDWKNRSFFFDSP
ncbi:gamma-glutamylcyclotransferase family protein [Leptospira idonii]|uniref:Gamma-glutamylcyclotransferase n=1 Tax=Leptospira idonii TaxID=1193500 RepID=A0A4R9M1L6_9LEPT|nr:gamma-glutamylcyclotransferase family protein [Leptospira idonii]TGN19587.1 gamma-glutamylcyclotransferase [Leptospira idonii]